MKTENLPANPYELPPLSEGDGYTKDATRWSGGMALGQPSSDRETNGGDQRSQHRIVAEVAGVCSAKAREAHYRMRYRRIRREQTPAFVRRWG